MTLQEALELGLQYHQADRLAEAESLYRQVLASVPDQPDAWHLLGALAQQTGHNEAAVEYISKALSFNPDGAHFHRHLGIALQALNRMHEADAAYSAAEQIDPTDSGAYNNHAIVLQALGRFGDAVEASRAAIKIDPRLAESHSNLGNALRTLGDLNGAIDAYQRSLRISPAYAEAHNNLACVLLDAGQYEAAVNSFRSALALRPDLVQAHLNLGRSLRRLGRFEEAAVTLQNAIRLDPTLPDAHRELGDAFSAMGKPFDAINAFRAALKVQPNYPTAANNLGNAYHELHRFQEAVEAYKLAIQLAPEYGTAYSNLSCVYRDAAMAHEAIEACRQAIKYEPNSGVAHNNLGCALKDEGDMDGALEAFREAHRCAPQIAQILSNVIYTMHSHLGSDAEAIAREHRRWNDLYVPAARLHRRPFDRNRDPNRKLRVGYVSPNFWGQAECYFVLPLLRGHDSSQFEIHAYSLNPKQDEVTAQIKKVVARWHDVPGLTDAGLAQRIREDEIDVLVDLTMHMAECQLTTFAMRPAPVQISWLAYPGTTGVEGVDYWITDSYMEPPEFTTDDPGGGQPYRLPDSWCCYHPLTPTPEVNDLPALKSGHITFGSLNNFCKVNEAVLEQWSKVLHALPDSRLVLLCPPGVPRERILHSLEGRGISASRIEFHGHLSRADYFALYNTIDIGLDPFPYNGITTTNDALWMGVPVVSMPGSMPAARAGLSLLTTAGYPELAPATEEAYLEKIRSLAADLPALAKIRAGLRERFSRSPILDNIGFARQMEKAYRTMWERWCERPDPV